MKTAEKGFTLLELAVVLAMIALLAMMLLPALASVRGNSQQIACVNNLKQVGAAFRIWEANHSGRYPMQISTFQGGASEYLSHSSGAATPTAAIKTLFPGMAFMVMSNELATTRILFCPSDNIHNNAATNFSYTDLLDVLPPPSTGLTTPMPGEPGNGTSSKISYFVNADATEANPQDILTGDDNIGNNGATSASAAANFRFGGSATGESCYQAANGQSSIGITSAAYGGNNQWWSWTAIDFHLKSGNLGMTDGSCQMVDIPGLHSALSFSTNSAAAETINFMP